MKCGFRVPDALWRALAARGFSALTPVQNAVLEAEPGRDLLVSAATGSGKTLAIGLALRDLAQDPDGPEPGAPPRALILTPTRELARQVRDELHWFYAQTGLRVLCVAGGRDIAAERRDLALGAAIVVGSPGRLRDQIERGALDASRVGCVVLDEADDMLDRGFRADLEFLLSAVPPGRRTLMFSATLSERVEALASRFQADAARIAVPPEAGAGGPVVHQAISIAPGQLEGVVANVLRCHEARCAIVFCARRETVAHLAARLAGRRFSVVALSGALSQKERDAAMAAMREGRARVCVATDLAARGLDFPGLDLVVHADPPANAEALTHRAGRTGRAGRAGLSVLVASHPLRRRIERMFQRAGLAVDWVRAPDRGAVRARDVARLQAEAAACGAPDAFERRAAARLLAACGPERIALAYLRRHAASLPEPVPVADAPAQPRGLPPARASDPSRG